MTVVARPDPAGPGSAPAASLWRWVRSPVDGTPLFVDWHAGATTPVVLLDGIGCDGYIWRYLLPTLGDRGWVHPHHRGHGRSALPSDPARVAVEDLADDIAEVLDELGIDQAILVGHSMGVQVALETWRRHRRRVAGLALLCGAPGQPLRTFTAMSSLEDLLPRVQGALSKTAGFANWVARAVFPTRLSYEIATRLEIQRDLVDPRDFMPYLVGMAHIDTRLFVAMLAAIGRHSAEDCLGTIDVPTLVVAGGRDGFTPPSRSREMAAAIPGATLVLVEDGSHTAPIERPSVVTSAVMDFVAAWPARPTDS